eukprot:480228-Pleurochrysis_carterae.AAC.1
MRRSGISAVSMNDGSHDPRKVESHWFQHKSPAGDSGFVPVIVVPTSHARFQNEPGGYRNHRGGAV